MKKILKIIALSIVGFILLMLLISLFIPESFKKKVERERFVKDSIETALSELAIQKHNDSIADLEALELLAKQKADSTKLAQELLAKQKEDSIKLAQEESFSKQEALKAKEMKRQKSEPEFETYNGHRVYIGPRGGKYYMSESGKKVYIK